MQITVKTFSTIKGIFILPAALVLIFFALSVYGGLTEPSLVKLNPATIAVDSSGAWVDRAQDRTEAVEVQVGLAIVVGRGRCDDHRSVSQPRQGHGQRGTGSE